VENTMSLAVKGFQHRNLDLPIEKARLWLVRFLSTMLTQHSHLDPTAKHRHKALMIAPYKQLEEIARKRAFKRTRIQQSAFAIIAIGEAVNRRYLLQWNANWAMFNLIGGKVDNHKGDAGSFRNTIERELEEELGINCPKECRVGKELGQIHMEQFSHREKVVKTYHFALFDVQILPDLPISHDSPHYFARWLSTGRENIFVSPLEIQMLRTNCGRPISATTRYILQALGEISASSPRS
jgi:8-oxo-dGTP pyrophosphatase MutT (NUDIX family)